MVAKWFHIDPTNTVVEVSLNYHRDVLFYLKKGKKLILLYKVDSYYSKALNTPDGNRRQYYASYIPGFDISQCESPEIVKHLERLGEVEIDLRKFHSKALCCLICKCLLKFLGIQPT